MRIFRAVRHLVAMMVLSLGATAVGASLITYTVSGTLDTSFDTLHAGDTFAMTYSVDVSKPPSISFLLDPTTTLALFENVPSATIRISAFSASSAQNVLRQIESPSHDAYEIFGNGPVGSSTIGGLDISYFNLELHDPTGTAISDALTTLTAPSLASLPENSFWVIFASQTGGFGFVHGTISSIAVALVPEPATLMLLVVGIAPLARMRRRSRTR